MRWIGAVSVLDKCTQCVYLSEQALIAEEALIVLLSEQARADAGTAPEHTR